MGERNDDRMRDSFDDDLERDNQRGTGGSRMADLPDAMAGRSVDGEASTTLPHVEGMGEGRGQHARKGQAQSPAEETHFEPPKKKEYKAGWAKPKPKAKTVKSGGPKRRSGAGHKTPRPGGPKRP